VWLLSISGKKQRRMTDVILLIAQVVAVSCADTQVLETRVANQSLLKVWFCKAIQVDLLVIALSTESGDSGRE
jgi:hypothetical protein